MLWYVQDGSSILKIRHLPKPADMMLTIINSMKAMDAAKRAGIEQVQQIQSLRHAHQSPSRHAPDGACKGCKVMTLASTN
jgi:hypothetical protein